MRRSARTDDNHDEIVKAFRRLGWSVLDIHQIPNSADIIVGKWLHSIVIEIKDGSKPPSKQNLTDGEIVFKSSWNGDYRIIKSIDDVIELDAEYKKKLFD